MDLASHVYQNTGARTWDKWGGVICLLVDFMEHISWARHCVRCKETQDVS